MTKAQQLEMTFEIERYGKLMGHASTYTTVALLALHEGKTDIYNQNMQFGHDARDKANAVMAGIQAMMKEM